MTRFELQAIFQDDKSYTLDEIKEVIYQLRCDVYDMAITIEKESDKLSESDKAKCRWYYGEENAFYITLRLLDKIKEDKDE